MNNYLLLLLLVFLKDRGVEGKKRDDGTRADIVKVPNVITQKRDDAVRNISHLGLNPVVELRHIGGGDDKDIGFVVDQNPKSGEGVFVPPDTDIKLIVSLGARDPAPQDEDLVVDLKIQKDLVAQNEILKAQGDQIQQILDKIECKDTTKSAAGATEKK